MRPADDDDETLMLPGELKPRGEDASQKRQKRRGPRTRTRKKIANKSE